MGNRRIHMKLQPTGERRGLRFSLRMRTTIYWISGLTWLTGVAWLVLHYYLRRRGDFGIEPHPLEPWSLKAHGLTAFAAIWLAGVLWASHIVPAWHRRKRPASGLTLAILLAVLIVSGYLLYYVGEDTIRSRVAVTHWALGLALPVSLVVHVLQKREKSRRRGRREHVSHEREPR